MSTVDNSNIHRRLDEAFAGVPMTGELQDLKEELRGNLAARLDELIAAGTDADLAATRALDELGDVRELVAALDDDGENDWRRNRVRPKPGFVIRTVIVAALLLAGATLFALGVLGLVDWPGGVLVLAACVMALAGGAIVTDSLSQETSLHYPVPPARAVLYGACTLAGFGGLALLAVAVHDLTQSAALIAGIVLASAAIIGFIWLGTTQTNRTKPWVRAAARQLQPVDRFTQDPAAAARFGIYAAVIWLVAIVAFVVLSIVVGFVWSWLALAAGLIVSMLVLARMLFPPDGAHPAVGDAGGRPGRSGGRP